MPTYAILGATGNIGLNVLRELGKQQASGDGHAVHVNAYARSRAKLLSLYPEAASYQHVSIHEGAIEDLGLLTNCLKDADAVFLTVAVSDNVPGCQIAQNTARLVVEALERLRSHDKNAYHLPWLVVLSSSSISEKLWRGEGIPPTVHSFLLKAASHVYHDLSLAETFLRTYRGNEAGDLYSLTFVKPGGLVHDARKGHVLSTTGSKTFTSFVDCAAGMVEIATSQDKSRWSGEEVSVNSAAPKGADVSFAEGWALLRALIRGLLCHFFPWSYRWL